MSITPVAVDAGTIILSMWVLVSICVLTYILILNIRFLGHIKNHRKGLPDHVSSCLDEIRAEMNIKSNIKVIICETAATPCLFGLFRPEIILNEVSIGDEAILRHVLLHELIHYKQKDHIIALLRILCCAVYWFNSLVWIGAAACRKDSEQSCDAKVIDRLERDEQFAYGETLLKLVRTKRTRSSALQTATTMSSGKKTLKN